MSLRQWRAIDKVSSRCPRSSAKRCRDVGDQYGVPGTWCPRNQSRAIDKVSSRCPRSSAKRCRDVGDHYVVSPEPQISMVSPEPPMLEISMVSPEPLSPEPQANYKVTLSWKRRD